MTRADVYWHTRLRRWSLRIDGRVADHLPVVALAGCRMVVRETERQRCVARGQRSVHAWITGRLITPPQISEAYVRIGYSPWHAGAFTARPRFTSVHAADLVVFAPDGTAWALVPDYQQMEIVSWRVARDTLSILVGGRLPA